MLENAKIIFDPEAGTLDKALKEYQEVDAIIKDYIIIKNKDAKVIKTICNLAGSYQTAEYTLNIIGQKGSETIDKERLKTLYPEAYKDCLKVGDPVIKIGKIIKI